MHAQLHICVHVRQVCNYWVSEFPCVWRVPTPWRHVNIFGNILMLFYALACSLLPRFMLQTLLALYILGCTFVYILKWICRYIIWKLLLLIVKLIIFSGLVLDFMWMHKNVHPYIC